MRKPCHHCLRTRSLTQPGEPGNPCWCGRALPLGEHQSEAEAQVCYDLGKMLVSWLGEQARLPGSGVGGTSRLPLSRLMPTLPAAQAPSSLLSRRGLHSLSLSAPAVARRAAGCTGQAEAAPARCGLHRRPAVAPPGRPAIRRGMQPAGQRRCVRLLPSPTASCSGWAGRRCGS